MQLNQNMFIYTYNIAGGVICISQINRKQYHGKYYNIRESMCQFLIFKFCVNKVNKVTNINLKSEDMRNLIFFASFPSIPTISPKLPYFVLLKQVFLCAGLRDTSVFDTDHQLSTYAQQKMLRYIMIIIFSVNLEYSKAL